MKLLLDTHTLIWFDNDDPKLSPTAKTLLLDPANQLVLSTVCLWEIQLKVMKGKLTLRLKLEDVVLEQQRVNDMRLLPIHHEHIYRVGSLPLIHDDPFDRLLVAQALVENATLVSCDPFIAQYPAPVVW